MQFYIYSNARITFLQGYSTVLIFTFYNVHANRIISQFLISELAVTASSGSDFYYTQFPHEVHCVKKHHSTWRITSSSIDSPRLPSVCMHPLSLQLNPQEPFFLAKLHILQEENSSNMLLNWNKDSTRRSLNATGI